MIIVKKNSIDKTVNNLCNVLVEFVGASQSPECVEEHRRLTEARELRQQRELKRQKEIKARNMNIRYTKRKLSVSQKMHAEAVAREQALDVKQGEMNQIPSPNGSLYARVEPEKLREVIALTWHNNNHLRIFNDAKPSDFVMGESEWSRDMSVHWQLAKDARLQRTRIAPRGSVLSGCFWGTVLASLVGELPKHINAFDVLNKIPLEKRQEFLEDWIQMLDREEEERSTESNREIDDASRQDGDGAKNRNHFINEMVA